MNIVDKDLDNQFSRDQFTLFDPLTLPKNFAMAIYGQRRSGKSVILKDVLNKVKKWYKNAYLFSETIDDQPMLYNFIPKENRFNSFNQEAIRKLYEKQQGYVRREMDKNPKVDKTKLDHILIIFDDCINDTKFRSSEILNKIHVSGRHSCVANIVLSQYIGGSGGLNAVCRTNVDVVISLFLKGEYHRELLITQYLSMVNKKIGNQVYRALCSEEYHAIVIENYKTSQEYNEFVHWYLADPKVKDYMIGENLEQEKPIKILKLPESKIKYNVVLEERPKLV